MATATHRVRSCLRSALRDRRGTTALEFALTGLACFGLILFSIALGFRLYVQVALDYASGRAARMLAVDSTQSLSRNANSFQTVTFCPLLSAFLACSNISIALVSVTDYHNSSSIGGSGPLPFTSGQSGSLMLLQATYRLPGLGWPLPSGRGASGGFAGASVTADYPYQNEY